MFTLPNRFPKVMSNVASTPLSSIQSTTMQSANPQTTSALLSKLPLELREQVYKHVLLGWGRSPIVHIHSTESHVSHYRCQIEPEDEPCDGTSPRGRNTSCTLIRNESEARTTMDEKGWGRRMDWYVMKGMSDNLLPMLISCKKVYVL